MSLEIHCPRCGVRPVEEFLHGALPSVPAEIQDPDARDVDQTFMRDNPEGPVRERWFHVFGCRRWMSLTRDTRDDTIREEAVSEDTEPGSSSREESDS